LLLKLDKQFRYFGFCRCIKFVIIYFSCCCQLPVASCQLQVTSWCIYKINKGHLMLPKRISGCSTLKTATYIHTKKYICLWIMMLWLSVFMVYTRIFTLYATLECNSQFTMFVCQLINFYVGTWHLANTCTHTKHTHRQLVRANYSCTSTITYIYIYMCVYPLFIDKDIYLFILLRVWFWFFTTSCELRNLNARHMQLGTVQNAFVAQTETVSCFLSSQHWMSPILASSLASWNIRSLAIRTHSLHSLGIRHSRRHTESKTSFSTDSFLFNCWQHCFAFWPC